MNIPECESWARTTAHILERYDSVLNELDKLSGYLDIVRGQQDLQRMAGFSRAREEQQQQAAQVLDVLVQRTGVADVEGVRDQLTELGHCIQQAREAHAHWRRAARTYELFGKDDAELDRPALEQELTALKQRAEVWAQAASALIPDAAQLVRPSPVVLVHG